MIRSIIFDLGKVIIPFDWQRGYKAFAEVSPYPPEEIRRRIKEEGLFDSFERGGIEPRELVRRVSELWSLDISYEKFCELWSAIFLPVATVPEEMLSRLRAVGKRLLLLSNTDPIHYAWVMERYPVMRQFDHCVLSFRCGSRKPEPEIYREAILQAGCRPEEIFFTDDLAANIDGARLAGIDAVQFHSLPELERELKSRGLEW